MKTAQFQLHADIEQRHWWFVARRRIMRSVVREVLPPSMSTTVLDVGCGTGGNIAALADDYRCVGIDTSAEAIELAARRFPRVRFECGLAPIDIADMMPQARMILLMDVLEHVPDDVALLSKLAEAAAPGTYFLITVPADPSLWSEHDVSFGHYRRYMPADFCRVWSELRLRLRFTSFFNSRLYPLVKAVRTMNRWRGHAQGEAGTDFNLPSPAMNGLLERVFAGEASRLKGVLHGRRRGYACGVSLMALLERE